MSTQSEFETVRPYASLSVALVIIIYVLVYCFKVIGLFFNRKFNNQRIINSKNQKNSLSKDEKHPHHYNFKNLTKSQSAADTVKYVTTSIWDQPFDIITFKKSIRYRRLNRWPMFAPLSTEKLITFGDVRRFLFTYHLSKSDLDALIDKYLNILISSPVPSNTTELRQLLHVFAELHALCLIPLKKMFDKLSSSGPFANAPIFIKYLKATSTALKTDDFPLFCHNIATKANWPACYRSSPNNRTIIPAQITSTDVVKSIEGPLQDLLAQQLSLHDRKAPPFRSDDYVIECVDSSFTSSKKPNYTMKEISQLRKIIDRYVADGILEQSLPTHIYSFPKIIKNSNGDMDMVVDYRNLNENIKLLPTESKPFREIASNLGNPVIFSSMNIKNGYHNLKIAESSKPYTTIKTPLGFFQFNVLPFGLSNSPEVFNRFMLKMLAPHKSYCRFYSAEILIFSSSPEEHIKHLKAIFTTLNMNYFPVDYGKSAFAKQRIDWLGYTFTSNGIHPSKTLVSKVNQFVTPKNQKDVRSFLGYDSQLQSFIPNYSGMIVPLTKLLTKNTHFVWTSECEDAFQRIKDVVSSDLTVHPFDPSLSTKITTEVSDYAVGVVLWQASPTEKNIDSGKWFPIECASKKLLPAQAKSSYISKEHFAVNLAQEKFKYYIRSTHVNFVTNDKNVVDVFSSSEV